MILRSRPWKQATWKWMVGDGSEASTTNTHMIKYPDVALKGAFGVCFFLGKPRVLLRFAKVSTLSAACCPRQRSVSKPDHPVAWAWRTQFLWSWAAGAVAGAVAGNSFDPSVACPAMSSVVCVFLAGSTPWQCICTSSSLHWLLIEHWFCCI